MNEETRTHPLPMLLLALRQLLHVEASVASRGCKKHDQHCDDPRVALASDGRHQSNHTTPQQDHDHGAANSKQQTAAENSEERDQVCGVSQGGNEGADQRHHSRAMERANAVTPNERVN